MKRGILSKLIKISLISVIIPFICGSVLMIWINYSTLTRQIRVLNNQLTTIAQEKSQELMDNIADIPLQVYYESVDLQNCLRSTEAYTYSSEHLVSELASNLMASYDFIWGVDITGNNRETIQCEEFISKNRWRTGTSDYDIPEGFSFYQEETFQVGCYRKLLIDYPQDSLLAEVVIYFDISKFDEIASSVAADNVNINLLALFSEEGTRLYSSQTQNGIETSLLPEDDLEMVSGTVGNDKGYFFAAEFKVQDKAYTLVRFIDRESIIHPTINAIKLVFVINLVLLLLILFYIINMYHRFFSPIQKIAANMEKVKEGVYEYETVSVGDDEISYLDHKYEEMVESINTLINKDMKNEIELSRARLKMLQAQINPHFLNNILQYIGTQALYQGAYDANESISQLARMLQYNMDLSADLVELMDEINYIENYMKLQSGRYENRLFYQAEYSDEATKVIVPKMILQPLIENSIKYGHISEGGKTNIHFSANVIDGILEIMILDDGKGFTEDQIIHIRTLFTEQTQTDEEGHGIGLLNVLWRLSIYRENGFEWEITSKENVFAKLKLRIKV